MIVRRDVFGVVESLQLASGIAKAIDTKLLKDRVRTIEYAVGQIGRHLTSEFRVDLTTAFESIEFAAEMRGASAAQQELSSARQSFHRIRNRVAASSGVLQEFGADAEEIQAVAHAGEYFCLMLLDEPRLAYISAYRATELFPLMGVQVFPTALFSHDYSQDIRVSERATEVHRRRNTALLDEYRSQMAAYHRERRRFLQKKGGEWALRIGATAGVGIGMAVACCVNPGYAGAAFHNVRSAAAHDYLDRPPVAPARPLPPRVLDGEESQVTDVLRKLAAESHRRRVELESTAKDAEPWRAAPMRPPHRPAGSTSPSSSG